MLAGAAAIAMRFRTSPAHRVLAVAVLLYPIPDLLWRASAIHALRCFAACPALVTLAAVGAITLYDRLQRLARNRAALIAPITVGLFGLVVALSSARFLYHFFGDFNHDRLKRLVRATDLLEACKKARPRAQRADLIYCTQQGVSHGYVYTLIGFNYDPRQWFADPREYIPGPAPDFAGSDVCRRYGKNHFMFSRRKSLAQLQKLRQSHKRTRVLLLVRPDEIPFLRMIQPVFTPHDPRHRPTLLVYDLVLGGPTTRPTSSPSPAPAPAQTPQMRSHH